MSPTDSQLPPGAWGAFSCFRKILVYLMILQVIEMTPIGGQGITTFEQPGQATPSSPDVSPTDSQLPPTAWGAFSCFCKVLVYLMILQVIEMTPVGDQGIV